MRCLECKIVNYDKATNKWTCPAHPWAEIDLYTEHRNCGANRWYPSYVKDRVEAAMVKAQNYKTFNLVVDRAIEDGKRCNIPEYMLQELDALKSSIANRTYTVAKEFESLVEEHERLKKNGLA